MNSDHYVDDKANLKSVIRVLKFFIVVIGVASVASSILALVAIYKHTTILVPPGLDRQVEVSAGRFSEPYLISFARYSMLLGLDYAPTTARSQFDDLLLLFHKKAYKDAYRDYYALADFIESNNISSQFFIDLPKVKVNMSKKIITVAGLLRQYKNQKKIIDRETKYFLHYDIEDGQLKFVSFKEEGN